MCLANDVSQKLMAPPPLLLPHPSLLQWVLTFYIYISLCKKGCCILCVTLIMYNGVRGDIMHNAAYNGLHRYW